MSDTGAADGPPPFEDVFSREDVEQRVYGTIIRTREPTAASTIADAADCDPKSARKYLRWFEELGIVTRYDGHPATYERNDSYFEWRRINQIAADRSVEELQDRVRGLTARITEYEDRYNTESPAEVDAVDAVDEADDRTIDDVYSDLAEWSTVREERDRCERARQQRARGESKRASG